MYSQFDAFLRPHVTLVTYRSGSEPQDSYQGMPSGMPNDRTEKTRLQPLFLWLSPRAAPTQPM